MAIPTRIQITTALVNYLRERGPASPTEVYTRLAEEFGLTEQDLSLERSGRSLFEHEVRWAKQELVDLGTVLPPSIAGHGWWALMQPAEPSGTGQEVALTELRYEGAAVKVLINRFERDSKSRSLCIAHYGSACRICGFDFSRMYGPIGDGRIHVHHLVPLSSIGEGYVLDPIADLRPVCPNCHYMIHLRSPPFSIDELRAIIERHRKF